MLYINTQDTAPVVYVPGNGWPGSLENLGLVVRNTTDKTEATIAVTAVRPAGFLLRLTLETAALHVGEWEYNLIADLEDTIATGLLVVSDGTDPDEVEYESENNVIQYEG